MACRELNNMTQKVQIYSGIQTMSILRYIDIIIGDCK